MSSACWSKNSNATCVYMYFVFCKHMPAEKCERKRNLNSGIGNHYYDYICLNRACWEDKVIKTETAGLNERLQV